ncbi:MAG TPA: hypothetical protein DCE42_11845 [Myxococcales bacterium]|nr:hypothetical protein [Deltaproteobacteria bacterium]MBU48931.1 hypothetical protein [Deltaproteobacteria bacterium]HAA55443.1 hypothetical protein [Myxococcales bacterium]|tara:strand:- start:32443 stop:32679 length:237 start_codon:yes stop_codon:yes gene_type:complete
MDIPKQKRTRSHLDNKTHHQTRNSHAILKAQDKLINPPKVVDIWNHKVQNTGYYVFSDLFIFELLRVNAHLFVVTIGT